MRYYLLENNMFPMEEQLKIKKECLKEHIECLNELEIDRRDYLKIFVNDTHEYKSPEKIFQRVIINILDKKIAKEKKIIKNLDRLGKKICTTNVFDLDTIKQIEIEKIMEETPTMTSQARLTYRSPFREEKVGSLVVYKDSNTWYDFGEAIGGDNISLIMKMHNMTFVEACNYIKNLWTNLKNT